MSSPLQPKSAKELYLQDLVLSIRVLRHEPVQHDYNDGAHDDVHGQVSQLRGDPCCTAAQVHIVEADEAGHKEDYGAQACAQNQAH